MNIYDVTGKLISTLIDEFKQAGFHVVTWDGKTDKGESAANGCYFYELKSNGYSTTRKMIVLK